MIPGSDFKGGFSRKAMTGGLFTSRNSLSHIEFRRLWYGVTLFPNQSLEQSEESEVGAGFYGV